MIHTYPQWIAQSPHHILALQEVVFEKRGATEGEDAKWTIPLWLEDCAEQVAFCNTDRRIRIENHTYEN